MRGRRISRRSISLAAVLMAAVVSVACGGSSDATPPPVLPTAGIYDEFLKSRALAARLTSAKPGEDAGARERRIMEDRKLLKNLEAAVASKRTLLADSQRDRPDDRPNESLYFQIWSGQFGDGPTPAFTRLAGGSLEYAGKQFTKETAMQCAVPARLKGHTHRSFLECLTTLDAPTVSR